MGRIDVFQGENRKWYFHRVADNGKITAASQGYRSRWNAKRAARKLFPGVQIRQVD